MIGGGISGLSFGRHYENCVVYDTGKRSVGGRCSSRLASETGFQGAVDHGAQIIGATDPMFQNYLEDCVDRGVLRRWETKYVGTRELGISALPRDLAEGLDIRGDVWVPPSGGIERREKDWLVEGKRYDGVVIAHNGKCAERLTYSLMSPVSVILRARFRGTKAHPLVMSLKSMYSLVFEVDKSIIDVPEGLRFFPEDRVLSFIGNNGMKLGWSGNTDVWTALSTGAFARQHKVPQESLKGTETETTVISAMLDSVNRLCGRPPAMEEEDGTNHSSMIHPVSEPLLQLWGAALPLNTWTSEANFVWDAHTRIGIVGDWLLADDAKHPASSIEAAFLSGYDLAEHLHHRPQNSIGFADGIFTSAHLQSDFTEPPPKPRAPPRPTIIKPKKEQSARPKKKKKGRRQRRR